LTAWADAALAEIRSLALSPARLTMDAATLLAERAALMKLPRPGRVSAGGACHLLDCADGAIALSLPRPDDWQLLPALFEDASPCDWQAVGQAVTAVYVFCWIPFGLAALFMLRFLRVALPRAAPVAAIAE